VSGLRVLKNPFIDMTPIRAVFDRCLAPGESVGQQRAVAARRNYRQQAAVRGLR
jgi:hypothetical protein